MTTQYEVSSWSFSMLTRKMMLISKRGENAIVGGRSTDCVTKALLFGTKHIALAYISSLDNPIINVTDTKILPVFMPDNLHEEFPVTNAVQKMVVTPPSSIYCAED